MPELEPECRPKYEPYIARHGYYIPARMMAALWRYILQGVRPGDFLMAVLNNDLRAACERADEENLKNLPAYIMFLYNEAPGGCWGSPLKVQDWIEARRPKVAS